MKKILFFILVCGQMWAAEQKRAIVFGATSILGSGLVLQLLDQGYMVAACDSDVEALKQLKEETNHVIFVRRMKAMHAKTREELAQLMQDMGGSPDVVIMNESMILQTEAEELDWERQYRLLRVNVIGYASVIQYFMQAWKEHNHAGHVVSIIQNDSTRDAGSMPFSNVSTEFITTLSDEMGNYAKEKNVPFHFTTVLSDWEVISPVKKNEKVQYSQDSLDQSVKIICDAIASKTSHVQISKHWHLISMLLKIMPDWLYKAVGGKS